MKNMVATISPGRTTDRRRKQMLWSRALKLPKEPRRPVGGWFFSRFARKDGALDKSLVRRVAEGGDLRVAPFHEVQQGVRVRHPVDHADGDTSFRTGTQVPGGHAVTH